MQLQFLLVLVALLSPSIAAYGGTKRPQQQHQHHHYSPPSQPELLKPRAPLEPVFQWPQIDFYDAASPDLEEVSSRSSAAAENATYIQYNNVPLGVARFKDKLFVTVPRRAPGIPSTLNYVSLNSRSMNPSPLFRSYPDSETNRLDMTNPASPDRILSVYRPRVDYTCERLWFIDTGLLEFGDRVQVQQPSIWIIDLNTGRRVHRFEIPTSIVTTGIGLASLTIDVEPGHCDAAFAYIPDFFNSRLHVFSLAEDQIWTVTHAFFYIDPLQSDFRIAGQRYQWRDGIFSITLGPKMDPKETHQVVMFHSMSSLNEFTVSTAVLQNRTLATRSYHGDDFQLLGRRQEMAQSAMHGYEPRTGVVFYAEVGRNSVGCWNAKQRFTALNHDIVYKDDVNMIYPADLSLDDEGNVWVLSNTMPRFIYSRLDTEAFNFKVWTGRAQEMIKGTKCEV